MKTQNEKVTEKNSIAKLLEIKAKYGFTPSPFFYERVMIRRKRWAMLCRNEVVPTVPELKAVCNFFEANPADFI